VRVLFMSFMHSLPQVYSLQRSSPTLCLSIFLTASFKEQAFYSFFLLKLIVIRAGHGGSCL
jgi:hypothetical protein